MAQRRRPSVNIFDVAARAGVSKTTVARILSGSGPASPETRKRVMEAADALGYRPNHLARAMQSGSTSTIGVVLPDISSPFFSSVLAGISRTSRAAGFEVVVGHTENDPAIEARSLETFARQRVDGIIVAPVLQQGSAELERLAAEGLPMVQVDRRLPSLLHVPLVALDHAAASRAAVEEFVRHGHRRIAIVTEAAQQAPGLLAAVQAGGREHSEGLRSLRPSAQRLYGYLAALHHHGLDPRLDLVAEAAYDAVSATNAVHALLEAGQATAILCSDEVLTFGAYRAFAQRDLHPPQGVSFIGFDDQPWTTLVRPEVTVVDQGEDRLGREAATLLHRLLGGEAENADVILPASLCRRGSVASPA